MDIAATLKLIEEHLFNNDDHAALLSIADANEWIRKGGAISPDQLKYLKTLKVKAHNMRLARLAICKNPPPRR